MVARSTSVDELDLLWREALDLITESLAQEPSGVFASTLLLQRAEVHLWQGDARTAEEDLREARRQFGGAADMQFTAPMAFIEAELAVLSARCASPKTPGQPGLLPSRSLHGMSADSIWMLRVIFDWPSLRSSNRMGTSAISNPLLTVRKFISTWNA
jgi:hypothetical protein